jgi:hypothetical protein
MIKDLIPKIISMTIQKLLFSITLICTAVTLHAQNLPNKQLISLRAPKNVKVDGKALEWQNKMAAYNHATQVYYTMANDDQYLYLAIQATDVNVISRIMGRGITLSIQQTSKKDDKSAITVTYPIIDVFPPLKLRRKKYEDEDTTAKTADLIMQRNNALLNKNCKFIKVTGIEGLDTLTSVYNTSGVKAAGLFDNKKVYTCEFSIKISLLMHEVLQANKLIYHITVNGAKPISLGGFTATPGNEAIMQEMAARITSSIAQQSAPTDFWGEYSLSK